MSWEKHKKRTEQPYLNRRVCLDREEYEEFLFVFYCYLHHNLNILVYKYDEYLLF